MKKIYILIAAIIIVICFSWINTSDSTNTVQQIDTENNTERLPSYEDDENHESEQKGTSSNITTENIESPVKSDSKEEKENNESVIELPFVPAND